MSGTKLIGTGRVRGRRRLLDRLERHGPEHSFAGQRANPGGHEGAEKRPNLVGRHDIVGIDVLCRALRHGSDPRITRVLHDRHSPTFFTASNPASPSSRAPLKTTPVARAPK